jgi:alkaline phosphatase D
MPLARRRLLTLGATALAAPAFVRHARAADVPRFTLGVASGHPGPSSLVLWTRLIGLDLPDTVAVRWELAEDAGFARIAARGDETAVVADAHCVHAEPTGLAPGRDYFYRFSALGQQSTTGRTRTAPAPDAPATLHAAVASCQRWDHGQYAAWRHVATQGFDLVMFLGDYIYEYASPPDAVRPHDGPQLITLAQFRERYALYKSDPHLQAAHASAPWTVIWDDHEVQNDYAGDWGTLQQGESFLRLRAAAYRAWWEHQPVPKAMRPVGPDARIYHRLDWGRLARLQAVDGRQYRNPPACPPVFPVGGAGTVNAADCPALFDPSRSLLGTVQEQWLAEGWDLQRPWNLLVQTTLMARCSRQPVVLPDPQHHSGRYWLDGWDGFPAARQRLLQGAAARGLRGLVTVGGDVHAHYVANLKADYDDPDAPVVASEFCTTSISSRGAPQMMTDGHLRNNPHLLYGRSDQRGYLALRLESHQLQAELMAVQRSADALSPVNVAARFAVDPRQPGPQRE